MGLIKNGGSVAEGQVSAQLSHHLQDGEVACGHDCEGVSHFHHRKVSPMISGQGILGFDAGVRYALQSWIGKSSKMGLFELSEQAWLDDNKSLAFYYPDMSLVERIFAIQRKYFPLHHATHNIIIRIIPMHQKIIMTKHRYRIQRQKRRQGATSTCSGSPWPRPLLSTRSAAIERKTIKPWISWKGVG